MVFRNGCLRRALVAIWSSAATCMARSDRTSSGKRCIRRVSDQLKGSDVHTRVNDLSEQAVMKSPSFLLKNPVIASAA